jgi:nitrite reductase/ring-hydroxylating ferredoxin subunit
MAQWIAACSTGDIDPEDVIPFEHGGNAYAIYRSPDGAYYTTDGQCSHEQTLLCDGRGMVKSCGRRVLIDHAATLVSASGGRSMSTPFLNLAPARTRATRCGPLT